MPGRKREAHPSFCDVNERSDAGSRNRGKGGGRVYPVITGHIHRQLAGRQSAAGRQLWGEHRRRVSPCPAPPGPALAGATRKRGHGGIVPPSLSTMPSCRRGHARCCSHVRAPPHRRTAPRLWLPGTNESVRLRATPPSTAWERAEGPQFPTGRSAQHPPSTDGDGDRTAKIVDTDMSEGANLWCGLARCLSHCRGRTRHLPAATPPPSHPVITAHKSDDKLTPI